nr:hypothetical protein CFP56_17690 [Quercus suber]
MGSGEQNPRWSVFDGVKVIPAAPEALMAEIDIAISKLEMPARIQVQGLSMMPDWQMKLTEQDVQPWLQASLMRLFTL